MAVFSSNQVQQLYVAKSLTGNTPSVLGAVKIKADTAKSHVYLQQLGAGGLVRSDLVSIPNIMSAKATASSKLRKPLSKVLITLDSNVSATPVSGQNYLLEVMFRQYVGLGEDDVYIKEALVHATASMSAAAFYTTLYNSLIKNFSREVSPLVNIALAGDPSTPTGITIEQAEQPWVLGTMPSELIPFTVIPKTITVSGDELTWGVVTTLTPTSYVEDGKNIADLEYFCMGNRGDQYRNVGFPNVIHTTYLVDPTQKYDSFDIHYFYQGANESVQKSEKDLTIVAIDDGSHTLINSIITAFNTATGLSVSTL